ncbi:AAA family ATPase [Candidatus Pacearchaeota archaeon]|nr:AAA family ATPase [Candidatus Pacearchaeota archaeon]
MTFPPMPYVISDGILPRGCRMFLYGHEGSWKSFMTLDLARAISIGGDFWHYKTNPNRVLLVQSEIPEYLMWERCFGVENESGFFSGKLHNPDNIFIINDTFHLDDTSQFGRAIYEDFKLALYDINPAVLIIDPLYRYSVGDIEKKVQAKKVLEQIDLLKGPTDMSIILIGHTRKVSYDLDGNIVRSSSELTGSGAFKDWADTMIDVATNDPDSKDKISVIPVKTRHAKKEQKPFWLKFNRESKVFERVIG